MSFTNSLPRHSLIIGGASSGKSLFAEKRVIELGLAPIYIATSQAYDDEMQQKIDKHRARRGTGWVTIEEPFDLPAALSQGTKDNAILIDCATLWLTNLMLADVDIDAAEDAFLNALRDCASPVTIVSNEVGTGIVPDNAMARKFRGIQGRFNQKFATACGTVVFVIAGIPQFLKGKP